jgi:hypothetical protein
MLRNMLTRKPIIFATLMLIALPAFAARQEPKTFLATAKGDGILRVGMEEFKVSAVVVKLLEDGKAEINLVAEINVFLVGRWSRGDDPKEITIEINGNGANNSLEASGKLLLRSDNKSIDRLSLKGSIKTRDKNVEIASQAKSVSPRAG